MRAILLGLTLAVQSGGSLLACDDAKQLEEDISKVAGIVAEDESTYVADYLNKGPSILKRGEYLTAAMARNALNKSKAKIRASEPLTMAVARTMHRHAQDRTFPDDTREYGFALLSRLARTQTTVAEMTQSLAEEIVSRKDDSLKPTAERYLRDVKQTRPSTPKPRP